MHLENVVFDAVDPRHVGRFWEDLLGTEMLTDVPEGYETRLAIPDGPVLDLCFQLVPEAGDGAPRLRLGVLPDAGAADPEGTQVFVAEPGEYADTGPLAVLELAVADPAWELGFWSWLTGWAPASSTTLRHASGRGPVLALVPETAPKGEGKNPVHLDVRLAPGEATPVDEIVARGGRELHFDWGELPWRHFADPSGNEFCVLPGSSAAVGG